MLKPIAAGLLFVLSSGALAQDAATSPPPSAAQVFATVIAAATAEAVVARLSGGNVRPYDYLVKDAKEMKGFFN
ncbi:MAG TPA: hypothetical protein DEQ40_18165, partial [Oxalobacteraceae bacterium]|nr:hypothetical protein [Oxalobacteraceae bacterium]